MTATVSTPSSSAIARVLSGLVGKDVTPQNGTRVPIGGGASTVCGVCAHDGQEGLVALWACDLKITCHAGAALAMIPEDVAEECVDEKDIPRNIFENFGEILNVLTPLLNNPGSPRVKLVRVYGPGEELPAEVGDLAGNAGSHLDVKLDIQGYSGGCITLYFG